MLKRYARRILDSAGILDANDGRRADDNETAAFARSLEFIEQEIYRKEYPNLLIREILPLNNRIPEGAESFTYRVWDWFGMAKFIGSGAKDLPRVDIYAAEKTARCHVAGDMFGYSINDLAAAAFMGLGLDAEKGIAARRAFENLVDLTGAKGEAKLDILGILNHPNIPLLTAADLTGDWLNPATTSAQILDDLNIIANRIAINTKNAHAATHMYLPQAHYLKIATTPFSATDARSILAVFLQNHPTCKNVDQWYHLEDADAAGTGPRALCFEQNPSNSELVVTKDFTMLPPQAKGLEFEIPCYGKLGGVIVRFPIAHVYADDI